MLAPLKKFIIAGCLLACQSLPVYSNHQSMVKTPIKNIPIAIDINFTAGEQEKIIEAINEWNYCLNHQIVFSVVDTHFDMSESEIKTLDQSNGLLLLKTSTENFQLDSDISAMTDGIGNRAHKIFFFRGHYHIRDLRQKTLHELAHTLGAEHQSWGLMRREYNSILYHCIDYATAKQVANYQHIDIDQMNWCQ